MAQWIKAHATVPEHLSSIPKPTWQKITDFYKLSSGLYMSMSEHGNTCTHTINEHKINQLTHCLKEYLPELGINQLIGQLPWEYQTLSLIPRNT